MYLKALIYLTCLSLCSFSSCEDDCFDVFGGGRLVVNLENTPALSYRQGDTLWLSTDFSADLGSNGQNITLSETGGLFVTRMLRMASDSLRALPALTAFTPVATRGSFVSEDASRDPAATILRYRCPDGRCGFRQGFRLDSAGQYLLEVNGSAFDRVGESFGRCNLDGFFETSLDAPSNLTTGALPLPLFYTSANDPIRELFIDTTFRSNLLYFNVE